MSDTKLTKFIVLQERIKAQDALLRELVEALEWMNVRYRCTLSNQPVRDTDELFEHVEKLLRRAQAAMKGESK